MMQPGADVILVSCVAATRENASEIAVIPILGRSAEYLAWIAGSVRTAGG